MFVDTTHPFKTVKYPHTTTEDMAETARQVKAFDRQVLAIEADVRDQDALDSAVVQAIDRFGTIDCLIANAGIWTIGGIQDIDSDLWQEMIDINLTGVFQSAKAVVPHMIERQSGSVILTSSVNGIEAAPIYPHYAAAKFGVVGLMVSLAAALGPQGIRVNSVHPGAVITGMTDNQMTYDLMAGRPGGTRRHYLESGRRYGILKGSGFMDPITIAHAALFLNSDLASNVTGVQLPVDSGHLLIAGINTEPRS